MKITKEIILSGSTNKKHVTTAELGGLKIEELNDFDQFPHLQHLYLYENNIKRMDGLQSLYNLKTLYLQSNQIQQISGLERLLNLTFLNLRLNNISKLENLPANLETLLLDKQQSPIEIVEINDSLKTLSLNQNEILNLQDLKGNLERLFISDCQIKDSTVITRVSKSLVEINFSNNPIKDRRIRQRLVVLGLQVINDKPVSEKEREFAIGMSKYKRVEKIVLKTEFVKQNVIPHLPPYATQYRDLILQKMQGVAANPK
ncbi:hypothetical protein HDV04_003554 [Boothiomyces sp. JEL0838]|nr:hypothetical protein HDV04_003554 [Boothiomyces sp. JEL0838]